MPAAYAGWAAWELIETYLQTHSNQWPQGIADLQRAVTNRFDSGKTVHFDVNAITNHIAINWNVDVAALRASVGQRSSHPLLVTRRDGKPLYPLWGEDVEPNRKLEQVLGLPTGFLRATN